MPYSLSEKQNNYQKDWIRQKRENRRKQILSGKVCLDCGFDDFRALHFHHRNPEEKEMTIGGMLAMNLDKLNAEIAKCDILCANCHSIRHYNQRYNDGTQPVAAPTLIR